MAAHYEPGLEAAAPAGLEAAPQNFPEVYQHHHYQHQQYADAALPKPEPSPSAYGSAVSPYSAAAYAHTTASQPPLQPPQSKGRTVCGCSLLVFILSVIIAILSAAVIGLAAGTGIEASRANDATSQLATLSASLAAITATKTTSALPTSTAVAAIDEGCEADPESVTGTVYTSFSLLGGLKFTRYCNKDAKYAPLMSLFTANFATCIDACASYSKYIPTYFGRGDNTTCGAVSFIPLWTGKVNASAGGAPGNCYLKPGPQNASTLSTPNIGTPCHAAVWNPGS